MSHEDRILQNEPLNEAEEMQEQLLLRPKLLKDYIGQDKLKKNYQSIYKQLKCVKKR